MTLPTQELVELLGRATGPDRELDAQIGRYGISDFLGYVPDEPQHGCPAYTASIEAAMGLVDPRALWAIGNMEDGPFARLCWPMPNGGYAGGYQEATGATPAIAMCIAALKARTLLKTDAQS